jgi:endonuclease G
LKKIIFLFLVVLSLNLFAEPISIIGDRYEKSTQGKGYVLYYNEDAEVPALVWYFQTSEDNQRNDSKIPRPSWKEDKTITTGSVVTADYTNSGYDRGHMAPDADFSQTKEILALTYFMSNVVPQYHRFNAGIWLQLENRGRELANVYGKVLIISGPCLRSDLTRNSNIIGNKNLILVPEYFYKLFIWEDSSGQLAYEGFIVPHIDENSPKDSYRSYIIPKEQIEEWGQFILDDIELMF